MTIEKMKAIIFDLQQEEYRIKQTIQNAFKELSKLIKEETNQRKKNGSEKNSKKG